MNYQLMLKFICFLVLFAHNSCKELKENEPELFRDFPETKKLKCTYTNAEALFPDANLQVFDTLLVLTGTESDKMIHIYNKTTLNHITSAGRIGKSDGEITNPAWNTWDKNRGIIWYPDIGKKEGEIFKFEIDSILNYPDYKAPRPYKIPSKIRFTKTIAPYPNGNLFSYAVDNPEYYFYVADQNGKIIDSLNLPNKTNIYKKLDKKQIMHTKWYYYTFHPSKEKVFIAYHYADIIVGTDLQGNILFQKQGPDDIQEDPKHIDWREAIKNNRKTTYWRIRSDDKYVYCLYSGEIFFHPNKEKPIPIYGKSIFVFTWEGEPLIRLNLDHEANSFALDKDNNRILTFATDIGELVYYNFPFNKLDTIRKLYYK